MGWAGGRREGGKGVGPHTDRGTARTGARGEVGAAVQALLLQLVNQGVRLGLDLQAAHVHVVDGLCNRLVEGEGVRKRRQQTRDQSSLAGREEGRAGVRRWWQTGWGGVGWVGVGGDSPHVRLSVVVAQEILPCNWGGTTTTTNTTPWARHARGEHNGKQNPGGATTHTHMHAPRVATVPREG